MSHSVAALALTVLLVPLAARSADAPKGPPPKPLDAADWKKLFDGKSLDGWKTADFFKAPKAEVKDGAIIMPQGKKMTGVTYSKDDFPKMDYEFTLEGKKIAGNDFFCTTTFPVGKSYCSIVIGGWGGSVVGLSSIDGADASENETYQSREFKRDQWYRIHVRVTQKRVEGWIDKDKVIDLDTTDRKISIRLECDPSKPFGVATWDTTGAVRDIRVRPLTEADKKAIAEAAKEKKD